MPVQPKQGPRAQAVKVTAADPTYKVTAIRIYDDDADLDLEEEDFYPEVLHFGPVFTDDEIEDIIEVFNANCRSACPRSTDGRDGEAEGCEERVGADPAAPVGGASCAPPSSGVPIPVEGSVGLPAEGVTALGSLERAVGEPSSSTSCASSLSTATPPALTRRQKKFIRQTTFLAQRFDLGIASEEQQRRLGRLIHAAVGERGFFETPCDFIQALARPQ